jgi:small subunit ribosomal protein S13
MIFILGKNLNEHSKFVFSLKNIFGIGYYTSKMLSNDLNIGLNTRVKDLKQENFIKILKWFEKNKVLIANDLQYLIISNINNLKSIKTYRGIRHIYNLPARGQRTKTNSKSARKKTNVFKLHNK